MTIGPVWLVGCGNMGSAMLRGWISDGFDADQIIVIDPQLSSTLPGVRLFPAPPAHEPVPAVVVLAIKPQMLAQLAPLLSSLLGVDTVLVSILAGAEIATLRHHFPTPKTVLRAMPNLPASIGRGVTVLMGDHADASQRGDVESLMGPLGQLEWIEDEEQFHAITALSGSGPAFIFRFIAALSAGGVELGLPADLATRLALATTQGSAALALAAGESLNELADRVASPGGTTRAGLDILDQNSEFLEVISQTLLAAARRSRELAVAGGMNEAYTKVG